jgi:hypothetical protein
MRQWLLALRKFLGGLLPPPEQGCACLWAKVTNTGPNTAVAQYASKPGVSVDNYQEGFYKVDFGSGAPNLDQCAVIATVHTGGWIATAWTSFAEPSVVYVETFSTVQHQQFDADFDVMAFS